MKTTCDSESVKLWPFFEFVQKHGDKLSASFEIPGDTLDIDHWKICVNDYRETSTFLVFIQKKFMYWALCEVPWNKYARNNFYLMKTLSDQIVEHVKTQSDLRGFEYKQG